MQLRVVGDTREAVLLVENQADNAGEYKAFAVTFDNSGDDDTFAVELLGTLDFGTTQALVGDNVA